VLQCPPRSALAVTALIVALTAPAPAGSGQAPNALEAAFLHESYRPDTWARLRVETAAPGLALQVFRSGPERRVTRNDDTMLGIAMAPVRRLGAVAAGTTLSIRVGGTTST
jgi:hypothetical protein